MEASGGEERLNFVHLRELRRRGEADYGTIASFRAVLLFAYDVTLFSFFDLYHAAIPIFVPHIMLSPRYLWRGAVTYPRGTAAHVRTGWDDNWLILRDIMQLPQVSPDLDIRRTPWQARARLFWAQFAEPYYYPSVLYFISLADFVEKLQSTNLEVISAEMRKFSRTILEEAGRYWRTVLPRVLEPLDESLQMEIQA
mmetsp:Transcript_100977/g.159671  ORF Transcript_100977/g.159671 Transcript_100977/m.159671 type:complete len:197 (+) Transcript_100977:1-591(+)